MLKLLIAVGALCFGVSAYPNGAPVSMCSSMRPHHGEFEPQSQRATFAVSATPSNNGVVRVVVQGSQPFTGLLLEGRKSADGTAIGSFTNVTSNMKTLTCDDTKDSAVTHSDKSKKETVEVEWEAPNGYDDDIIFIATVVEDYSHFWMNLQSKPMRVTKRSSDSSSQSPTDDTIPASLYEGCGTRRNCVGSPFGCIKTKTCRAIIGVKSGRREYEFEMMALKSKYVAVGISPDDKMGGDNVLECVYENDKIEFENVNVYRSWNPPNQKANERLDQATGALLLESNYKNGNVYCKAKLNAITSVGEITFDLNLMPYYLLLAAGSDTSGGRIHYHDTAKEVSIDSRLLSDLTPATIKDPFYNGCNEDKNCFGYPDGCVSTQSCKAVVTILAQGSKYLFGMKSDGGAYVAVALSEDDKMGEDSVMECVNEQGTIKAYMSYNKPGEKANTRSRVSQDHITLLNSSLTDGVIHCEFTRSTVSQVMKKTYDLSKNTYFLLLASGSSLKENGVGFHDLFAVASGQKRYLSDVGAFTSSSKLLYRLHGAFMIAAWLGTASIGIVLARYFKTTWVESSLCAKDLWFAWHRFFMLMTWCLTIVAFVLIFVEVGGWVDQSSMIHAILGCTTTLLCLVQPIGAAFRPHPAARNRPVFNWLHWFIGNSAHIFAVVTIFFAMPLAKAELPVWLDWILVAFVALYVIVHLLLTIGGCVSDHKNSKRINSFPMKDMNTSRSALNSVERRHDSPLAGFRKFVLFIYIVGITAITAAVIVIIALAPIETQWTSLRNKFMDN